MVRDALLVLVLLLAGRSLSVAMEQQWIQHLVSPGDDLPAISLRAAGVIVLVAAVELLRLPPAWLLLALPPALLPPAMKWLWGAGFVAAAVAAAAVALARRRPSPVAITAITLLVLLPWLLLAGAWGDEWEYLANLDSLASDGDLNIVNQLANNDCLRYGRHIPLLPWFGPGEAHGLTPHALTFGFLALLAPGWLLLGRYGVYAMLVPGTLALGLAVNRYCAGWRAAPGRLTPLLLLCTLPVWPYTHHIYPELAAAVVSVLALAMIRAHRSPLPAAALLALLPWLNLRYLLLALPLLLLALRRFPERRARLLAVFLALLALLALLQSLYLPLLPKVGMEQSYFSWRIDIGLLGNFFDGEFGVLPYAPLWLWAAVGALRLWRTRRTEVLELLAVTLPYLLVMSSYEKFWYGGQAPPARFVVVLFPLWFPLLLAGIPPANSGWCRQAWRGAVLWSGLFALALTLVPVWQLNVQHDAVNQVLLVLGRLLPVNVNGLFPSWRFITPATWWLTLAYLGAAALIVFGCWRRYGRTDAA